MPKVYVNQQDTVKGIEGDSDNCVVACALRRKLRRKVSVGTGYATIYKKNNKTVDYNLIFSKRLSNEIKRYDFNQGFRTGHYSYAVEKE